MTSLSFGSFNLSVCFDLFLSQNASSQLCSTFVAVVVVCEAATGCITP